MYSPRAWSKPAQSGGLAEVASQLHDGYAAIDGCDLAQHGKSVIVRAVIHQHDFERLPRALHYGLQPVVEVSNVLLLIVQWDNDGIFGHSLFII